MVLDTKNDRIILDSSCRNSEDFIKNTLPSWCYEHWLKRHGKEDQKYRLQDSYNKLSRIAADFNMLVKGQRPEGLSNSFNLDSIPQELAQKRAALAQKGVDEILKAANDSNITLELDEVA